MANPAPQSRGFASKALECGDLDDYLSALLLPQFLQTFKYIPFSIPKSDIKKILSFVTFALSVKSAESTPACQALGLKLSTIRRSPTTSLLVYAILKLLMPHIRRVIEEKCIEYRTASTATADGKSSSTEALAQDRQYKALKTCLGVFDTTIPMLRLLLVLNCWTRIRNYSPVIPDLEKWLSGFRYEAAGSPVMPLIPKGESIHVLFAHRRWVQRWLQACVPILALPLLRSASESRELLLSWKEELQRCFVLPIWNFLSGTDSNSTCKRYVP
mmetsp:Transcript_27418/g.66596  ORF Transcript_27418/g.66596 Transcript_27418/m.66596 type:complete len:272 (-) Transcript_27418:46-861(-)